MDPNPWTADDLAHDALDITDALSTLVYLLRLDAADPALVCSYANQLEERLLALRTLVLTEQSACAGPPPTAPMDRLSLMLLPSTVPVAPAKTEMPPPAPLMLGLPPMAKLSATVLPTTKMAKSTIHDAQLIVYLAT